MCIIYHLLERAFGPRQSGMVGSCFKGMFYWSVEQVFPYAHNKKHTLHQIISIRAGVRPAAIGDDAPMSQRHPIQNDVPMFITSVTKNRMPVFCEAAAAREAIESLYRVQVQQPFFLYGFVIMPDHCHFLMTVPEPGSISKIMQSYKYGLSFNIGKGPIWQPRFHMRIPWSASNALRYIHNNPVKAGLCGSPENYPWSSASGQWDVMDLEYC